MPGAVKANAIEVQERDLNILRGLFDSRLMTLAHAASIHFDGSHEAAKKRIQKLKAAGFIGERKRKAYEPSVLFLSWAGYALLHDRGYFVDYPHLTRSNLEKRLKVSDLTLRHELEIMDVKAALSAAVRFELIFHIKEFSTWPLLFQFKASVDLEPGVTVKPDGFVRIHQEGTDGEYEHTFYLEVDRSSETLDTLVRKALCYLDHYQRGGLAVRAGRPPSEYKNFPFRVLMVFSNAERRNNIAERLLLSRPPIYTQTWLATMKEVIASPLGSIWIRPKDYREAVAGSEFDIERIPRNGAYQRQTAREQHVEQHIHKHCLLADETDGEKNSGNC